MSSIFSLASSLKTKKYESISLESLSGRKLSGMANKESWSWASPTSMSLWRISAPSPIPGNQGLPQKCTLRRALAAAWVTSCTWKISQIWSPFLLLLQFPHPRLSRLNFSPDWHTPCSSRNNCLQPSYTLLALPGLDLLWDNLRFLHWATFWIQVEWQTIPGYTGPSEF